VNVKLIEEVQWPVFDQSRREKIRAAHQNALRQSALAKREGREQSWYRIVDHFDTEESDVYIYDEIGLCGVEANVFVQDLNKITTPSINVHMNTPGGEVSDGITIYNALMNHPSNITTIVDGFALSAGSFIMQAGDRRVAMPQSEIMIHDAAGLCVGNAGDMRKLADLLDRLSNNIASVYAERAGGEVADWRARMLDESWYNPQEALDAGLATEIGRPPKLDEPADDLEITAGRMSDVWRALAFRYAGRQVAPAPNLAAPKPVAAFNPDEIRSAMRKAFTRG
jgi:ATP-dependent Clp endopeptidase proteolytic subunit ClpP